MQPFTKEMFVGGLKFQCFFEIIFFRNTSTKLSEIKNSVLFSTFQRLGEN